MRRVRSGSNLVVAMAMTMAVALACDDTTAPATSFTADMSNHKEIPDTISTNATGTAACTVSTSAMTITCTLNWTGLSGNAAASHIHLAAANASAGVRVNLCGAGTAPACPTGTAVTNFSSGAQTAIALTGQTAAQAFDQVVAAMRTYGAYVNVHTALHGGGETRGQLFGAY